MTVFRLRDRIKFIVERWLQRGVRTQLLFIAGVIASIAVLGGLIAWSFSDQFDHVGEAIWWGFLRLTDPGYLGDDQGFLLRTVSMIITVLGYVLFLGSLVAILTQWLNETMQTLERGLTPITLHNHVLILGWTNRTPSIVQELLMSEGRVRRFLLHRSARRLRVVILAEEVTSDLRVELQEVLRRPSDERRVILRSGTSLRLEHLRRVAYRDAAVVIIPGADFLLGGALGTDTRVIKTLISLSPRERREHSRGPDVVAEIFDAQKIEIAKEAYRSGGIDVVASDAFISRLIAQNVRHPGLSYVYTELLSHEHGNEIYVRSHPELAGRTIGSLGGIFEEAIPLGFVRAEPDGFEPHMNPPKNLVLEPDDRLVFIARSYEACLPVDRAAETVSDVPGEPRQPRPAGSNRRVLMLGWNHKVASLLREFGSYSSETFEIDILSRMPRSERTGPPDLDRQQGVSVRHLEGDYTIGETLSAVDPAAYDNIVFLASDSMESGEEADARTILGYVLLRSILGDSPARPEVVIELMDPANAHLFRHRTGEVIISPLVMSHMLAHIALRRELSAVFNELFGPGGAEIFFRPASTYGLTGGQATMAQIQEAAGARGEIALGIRLWSDRERPGGGLRLNPGNTTSWGLAANDEIVVLATT